MTPIPPAPPTPPPPPPAADAASCCGGAPGVGATPDAAFTGKMAGTPGSPGAPGCCSAEPVSRVAFKDGVNPLDQVKGIREEIASIRAEMEAKGATGTLDPAAGRADMWRMLDLQTRAQDVHFRVEMVTKLVEHTTGGIKQLSQTQA